MSNETDRLYRVVDELGRDVKELTIAVNRFSGSNDLLRDQVGRATKLGDELRARVESIEQWKQGAAVKLALAVFVGGLLLTAVVNQFMASKPIYVAPQNPSAQARP